jgi:hypothetical protein
VSSDVIAPGSRLSDHVRVSGLGRTPATVAVELFGPFASRDAIGCSATPYWSGSVKVDGDGTFESPPVALSRVGLYAFRERIVGTAAVPATVTECGLVPETALVSPAILAGGTATAAHVAAPAASGEVPIRVTARAVGIDAPVAPVAIDLASGSLGIASDIHRTSWWRDGTAPGAKQGSVLIAGHVDSAKAGPGAFFRLHELGPGDRVEVTNRGGRTFAYRVSSVRRYRKADLPPDVYTRNGPARLVLVTCGGPFDAAAGHYRDNVVVTAVPM